MHDPNHQNRIMQMINARPNFHTQVATACFDSKSLLIRQTLNPYKMLMDPEVITARPWPRQYLCALSNMSSGGWDNMNSSLGKVRTQCEISIFC